MPSNRGNKKKANAEAGDEDAKRWKAAEVNMELLKEFEDAGGCFLEEATDEVSVLYGIDGALPSFAESVKAGAKRAAAELEEEEDAEGAEAKRRKKAKAKNKARNKVQKQAEAKAEQESQAVPSQEELVAENARMRAELASLRGETAAPADVPEVVETPDLPHWNEFDLHPALMKNIARLGFHMPSEVQKRCLIPAIRQRKDIVGAAETGSGKTLAFGLPILHHTLSSLDASSSSTAPAAPAEASGVPTAAEAPKPMRDLKALCILPTRELAVQVRKHLNDACEGTACRAECIVGGMSLQKQRRLLNRRPQIVVATPGRLFAMLGLGAENADSDRHDWLRNSLSGLRHLVLDEADRLVEDGHFRELDRILELVYSSVTRPQQLQTFVFSATLTLNPTANFKKKWKQQDGVAKVEKLNDRLKFREPRAVHIVDLNNLGDSTSSTKAPNGEPSAAVGVAGAIVKKGLLPEQLVLREAMCQDDKDKEAALIMWLLKRWRWEHADDTQELGCPTTKKGSSSAEKDAAQKASGSRVLVFMNAISSVLRITPVLALLLESPSADQVLAKVKMNQNNQSKGNQHPGPSVQVLALHSRMRQKDRLKRIERFRSSKDAILVCTDVAARGLDVKQVTSVLHFQAPRNPESFVHRSGRTARAGKSGESIAFVAPADHQQWAKLYKASGITKERVVTLDTNPFELSASREASKLAFELETKVHRFAKETGDKSWMKKAADEAELMLSEDEDDGEGKGDQKGKLVEMWTALQARVRRQPKRLGAGPIGRRRKL